MPPRPSLQPGTEWSPTGALTTFNQVDDWLAIQADGTVTVFSGKVELGTGVETALAQIVAEELDVPFGRIQMVMGDTDRTPDQGITAGSTTIRIGGVALRHASAEARRALLDLASDRLDALPEEMTIKDGVISVSADPERAISYAELIGGQPFKRTITLDAPLKAPKDYHVVGQPVQRVDIPRKVTGRTAFVHDIRLPDMLHGRVVRPPSAGAELASIDEASVRDARVVRRGNFVAVVAEREEQAIRAAQQLKAEWREKASLPRMGDLYEQMRGQAVSHDRVMRRGDVDAAMDGAARRVSAVYYQPFQAHASIGPSCGVADVRADRAVVWSSTQGVFSLRTAIAELLEMPTEKLQVIHVEGPGCYGQNGSDDAAADAAVLSQAVGQPVRVQWSRQEEFAWEPYAPAMMMEVQAGLDAQGRVVAWTYDVWTPTHLGRSRGKDQFLATHLISQTVPQVPQWFGGGDRNAPNNYTFPNQRVMAHWLPPMPLRTGSLRTLGGAANTFANESFMDELAAAAQTDPVEFRLRHLDDPRGIEVLKATAERAGWGSPLAAGLGRGVAYAQYENSEAYVAAVAEVQVNKKSGEVRVRRIVLAHDCGLVINPDGLRNQIEGNVIQSASRALKEEVTFDQTRITSLDWDTYPVLRFSEVPEVETVAIDRPDQPALGAGEPASITTAAAIANAIFNASGARVRQIPFTRERVKAAMP